MPEDTKAFRVSELTELLEKVDAAETSALAHRAFLTNPKNVEGCRDADVILANVFLAIGSLQDARRQLGIALKLTDLPEPESPPSQPEESTP